jgi:hypothetical protein
VPPVPVVPALWNTIVPEVVQLVVAGVQVIVLPATQYE